MGKNPENESTIYLRSTAENFRKHTANLSRDFPGLAEDVNLPDFEDQAQDFSSILRISSGKTQVWSHYDTIDNFLIQILGEKEVFLAPPSSASSLKLKTDSDKPDIVDPWAEDYEIPNALRFVLKPGDVLFLPSHWFHATRVINSDNVAISVNQFWKQVEELKTVTASQKIKTPLPFHDKKDLYGNRAPRVAQEAERLATQIEYLLSQVDNRDVRDFYEMKCKRIISNKEYF